MGSGCACRSLYLALDFRYLLCETDCNADRGKYYGSLFPGLYDLSYFFPLISCISRRYSVIIPFVASYLYLLYLSGVTLSTDLSDSVSLCTCPGLYKTLIAVLLILNSCTAILTMTYRYFLLSKPVFYFFRYGI